MLIMRKRFYVLFIPHGPGSRVKKKSSMLGRRLFGGMTQSALRIQVRKRPLSFSKVAFSSLSEMVLPMLKTMTTFNTIISPISEENGLKNQFWPL